ncbi:GyrI-like domain-containing protein [Paenibacillus montanisoli]|uniref:GyrI-like small molecule binding domain-containing protein n=1 Tax=Paenibacillus montanisoli TaxID=2081970 RepID=A0A328U684_9BACL|nr:GyrI-like domain-containing protein [Paenibacillus montanisoli]RAP78388.1 hypothetical protein DL346_08175 [Paenibacillus montanisoli]
MMAMIRFIEEPKSFVLYGHSKIHVEGTPYSEDVKALMGNLWGDIQTHGLAHRGINHMVYEAGGRVFAGVELEPSSAESGKHGMERLQVTLSHYLYGKHIGPYDRLCETYDAMRAQLAAHGKTDTPPLVEVYGHWSDDPAKLETEIFMSCE